jgi:hypothetical protein
MEPLKTFLKFVLLANALKPRMATNESKSLMAVDPKDLEAPCSGAIAYRLRVQLAA